MFPRAYLGGRFEFNLDGSPTSAWVRSVEGGAAKTEVITEHLSSDYLSLRHTAVLEYEPLTVEVALASARPFLQWIQESWSRHYSRRNGSILHGDFNLNGHLEQWFYGALISKVEFPALDATSNEPAYLKVEIQPERCVVEPATRRLSGLEQPFGRAKMWTPSMFALYLRGIDCRRVRSLDAIVIKQKIAKLFCGTSRAPEIEPSGIEFPGLTVTLAAAYAGDFIEWHRTLVVDGAKDPEQLKSGYLEFLHPSGHGSIFTIYLNDVGINKLSIEKSESGGEQLKLIKLELFADTMKFELGRKAKGLV